jgi:pilus assembly protein FimV
MAQAPVPEPSFLDGLMDDPAVLPAAGGLLALLAAGGLYVANKRKKNRAEAEEYDFDSDAQVEAEAEAEAEVDPKFEEQPFFNTANHEAVAQPPVLADPVLSSAPADEPAFASPRMPDIPEVTEIPVAVVEPAAPEPVMALPMTPVIAAVAPPQSATAEDDDNYPEFTPSEFSTRTVAQIDPESAKSPASVDLDLDFDFASDFPGMQARNPIIAQVKPMSAPPAHHLHTLDFELPIVSKLAALAAAAPSASAKPLAPATAAVDTAVNLAAPLEFNLDDLSLDLNAGNQPASTDSAADTVGPLETKLALAQEFRAIGDTMGAKMLAQEVIAMASGSLKTKAETLLSEIG